MILLIRCDKEVKSFNNWTTTFNSEMSDINDVFISNGVSTLLLYKKKLPHEVKYSTINKRGIKSLSSIELNLLNEECIILYHSDLIDKDCDQTVIEELFNYSHNTGKYLILQFSLENQHLVNHICTGSEVYIERNQLSNFLIELDRELKLKKLLN